MDIPIEKHPFKPFLPPDAKVLFLGSFPPPARRWSMPFYYPNYTNDFWHIIGWIWFNDKDHFCNKADKRFKENEIISFCTEKGIAMYDSACEIKRLKDNASDKFLEIVRASDILALLEKIPECRTIVSTGQKATETVSTILDCRQPEIDNYTEVIIKSKKVKFIRMPSTSRAYPLALEKKADAYKRLFMKLGMLP